METASAEDPYHPAVQRRKLKEMIERFAKKHGVSVDVAKKMMSDRHNKLMQEAEDTVKKLRKCLPVSID